MLTSVLVLLFVPGCKKLAPAAPAGPDATNAFDNRNLQNQVEEDDAARALAQAMQRVHFESDSSSLNAEARSVLDSNATLLREHAGISIEVRGHADERGTTDYNVALGQRRALAVKSYLQQLGISGARLTDVSYGEEDPLNVSSSPKAWAMNRRVDFHALTSSAADLALD